MNLAIEAMSLPSADSKDELCKDPGHALRLKQLADYHDPIVKRDLFSAYSPPSPPRKTDSDVDPADFAFVTGLTEKDGARQVWIQDRMADKRWTLKEGETFQVGGHQGRVQSITAEEVIVELDGQRRRHRVGENLSGGVEVKP